MNGTLIIYSLPDGENDWQPVKPADVPDWVKDPDNLARLVDGEACSDQTCDPPTAWYRAERVLTQADQDAIDAALNKRLVRAGRRIIRANGKPVAESCDDEKRILY